MGLSPLDTLIIAFCTPPAVLMITHIFSLRLSSHRGFSFKVIAATIGYMILCVNEVFFIYRGESYYFFNTIIDALVLLGTPYAIEPRVSLGFSAKKVITGSYVVLLLVYVGLAMVHSFTPMTSMHTLIIASCIALLTSVFGITEFVGTKQRHTTLAVLLLIVWGIRHIALTLQPVILNRLLTLFFFILLTIIAAKRIFAAQQKICEENGSLFSLWHRIAALLKTVDRSTENIHTLQHIHTQILNAMVDTVRARGAALYTVTSPGIGTTTLIFNTLVGRYFPIEPVEEPSLLQWQKLITDRLRGSAYNGGDGLVGTVAQREDALVLERHKDLEQMQQLRINTEVIEGIIAIPLTIHSELYGVVVVQNHRGSSGFSKNEVSLLRIIVGISALAIDLAEIYMELTKTGRLRKEADIARTIQNQLLPKQIPQRKHLTTSVFFKPAKEVGGDYYDFIEHPDNSLGIIIGDVSGKGVPAGMLMAIAKAVLHIVVRGTHEVKEIMCRFAKEMYGNIRSMQFITCNYLRWDDESRTLSFAGAGHEHILWFHAQNGTVERIKTGGVAVGFMEDVEGHTSTTSLQLEPGDSIALYTDGITELRNEKDEMFSLSRLQSTFENYAYLAHPDHIIDRITSDIYSFMGSREQYDDIILMVLTVR